MRKIILLWIKVKMFFTKAQTIEIKGVKYRAKKIGTITITPYEVK